MMANVTMTPPEWFGPVFEVLASSWRELQQKFDGSEWSAVFLNVGGREGVRYKPQNGTSRVEALVTRRYG